MKITMATFLCDDIRSSVTNDLRLDHKASNMMEHDIKKYPVFWIDALYKLLVVCTGFTRSRRRNVHAKRNDTLNHILECDEEENGSAQAHTSLIQE